MITFRGKKVTRDSVRRAMKEFDLRFRDEEHHTGTRWAVEKDEKRYPPKRILELATGVSRKHFSGGEQTNSVFQRLGRGFTKIVSVIPTSSDLQTAEEREEEKKQLAEPCPDVTSLLSELFSKTWLKFPNDSAKIPNRNFPGVYLISYSAKSLEGNKIEEKDVWYVGVSRTSLKNRLREFRMAVERGVGHSGGNRFFREELNGIPYSKTGSGKGLYVAAVAVPCHVKKPKRTGNDLRKIATVTALEYEALGRITENTGEEPRLNKQ